MNYVSAIGRTSLFLLQAFFLLNSCSTRPDKAVPKVYTVVIKQMQFQPAELTVQKGDTVIFLNQDIVTHNVTEESSKAWASSPMPNGASWRLVAMQSASYYCTIHPVMKGKLQVQ
jgi:plastocyanin